jgi:hypothetical protein
MLKRIWDGIFGVKQPAILPGQHAPRRLPRVDPQLEGAR